MRAWFRRLPIKTKLISIVMLASSVALLLACSSFLVYELSTYRDSAVSDLNAMAQMVAGTSTAAVAFSDHKAAAEVLNTLRSESQIVEACIYRPDGSQLAVYSRMAGASTVPQRPVADGPHFISGHLLIFRAVMLDGERVGTVYLKSDLAKMYARLTRYAFITMAVLLAALLAAAVVSSVLQRLISRPVLDLAETASRVSKNGNYTIRAHKSAEDEIGVLVDRFNEMLEQVHLRDEELQAAKDELEDRVVERTHQLQSEIQERKLIERDLILAKERAEASSKAKSVFLANMSHELRTPLNAIIGYSEMLEEEAVDEGLKSFVPDLRKIQGAGKHLLSLINDVLDLSKIEAGRMEIKRESFLIGQLVDETASTIEPLARKNGNRLNVICSERDSTMQADLVKFRQSLLNLLSNACKFTENGQITLKVHRAQAAEREWFDWEVSDTGIGIPKDQMHKLFQSFSQVDSSSTRRHGGTGLGLAITQRLCEMMGGRIMVDSEPGVGSKFIIRLPADAGPAKTAALTEAARPATPVVPVLLAIDPSPRAKDWLAQNFPAFEPEVIWLTSPKEGLTQALERRPAVILLNAHQQDTDAWELFRRFKSYPSLVDTPVLLHRFEDPVISSKPNAMLRSSGEAQERWAVCLTATPAAESENPTFAEALDRAVQANAPYILAPSIGFSVSARTIEQTSDGLHLDVRMNGESGRDLVEQLIRSKDWRRLSILRLSQKSGTPATFSSGAELGTQTVIDPFTGVISTVPITDGVAR